MSRNSVPRFADEARVWSFPVSAVNPDVDGSGSFDTIVTAPQDGLKIDLITLRAAGGVTTNTVRLFLMTPGNTEMLWEEVTVNATTAPVAGTEAWSAELVPTIPLSLSEGWALKAALETANIINVFAHGGLY